MSTPTFSDGRHTYSVHSLWEQCDGLPVEPFDIGFFGQAFHHLCWDAADGRPVSPAEVLDYPDFYPEHWTRIHGADLSFPILVTADGGHVIDGMHRLCHLWLSGKSSVPAQLVRESQLASAILVE
jgi:hypothetical protein